MKVDFVYNRKNQLNTKGLAPVEIRFTHQYKKKYVNLDIYLKPTEWNNQKRRVVKHNNAVDFNLVLNELEGKCGLLIAENPDISLDSIVKKVFQKSDLTFNEFLHKTFLPSFENERTYKSSATFVRLFDRMYPDFPIKNMDQTFFDNFKKELEKKKADHKNENALMRTTAKLYLGKLRTAIRMMLREGIIDKEPFFFKGIRASSHRDFLTDEEVQKIYEYVNSPANNKHKEVMEIFLFSCYTGLRFQSMNGLSVDHLINGNSLKIIPPKTMKHDTVVVLNLEKLFWGRPLEILKKHGQISISYHDNKFLTRVCKKLGIETHVTWHVGRHTFACSLLNMGLRIEAVSKLLGHKRIETTQIYAKMLNKTIEDDLDKIFS